MTHRLEKRNPMNAVGRNPLVVKMRYECPCHGREVLQISVVIDNEASEEQFVDTMKQMWRDINTEVSQHLKQAV